MPFYQVRGPDSGRKTAAVSKDPIVRVPIRRNTRKENEAVKERKNARRELERGEEILDESNTSRDVYADSAYRSAEHEAEDFIRKITEKNCFPLFKT